MAKSIPLTSNDGFEPFPLRSGALIIERSGVCVQINPPIDLAAIEAAKQKIRQVEYADAIGFWMPMDPLPGYKDWKLVDDNRPTLPADAKFALDGSGYVDEDGNE